MIHTYVEGEAPRSAEIVGNATLAIAPSSTAMDSASQIAAADQ